MTPIATATTAPATPNPNAILLPPTAAPDCVELALALGAAEAPVPVVTTELAPAPPNVAVDVGC